MKEITVVINENADECLYINGKAWESTGETTVYATDIADAAGDEPILFRHVGVDWDADWPENLSDLPTTDN